MKRQGLVRSANKTFELSARGLEVGARLVHAEAEDKDRLTKQEQSEINRIVNCAAFDLFQAGQKGSILDTDVYAYLGVTARTSRADCHGRLSNVESAIAAHEKKRADELSSVLRQLHGFLTSKFTSDIDERK